MSFTWKDTTATISLLLVVVFTVALMLGAFNNIDSRWALGTAAILLLGGVTGLITGTASMMQRAWSTVSLYILSIAALTITVVNAFINSEAWFIAMMVAYALIWIEFVGIDLFSKSDDTADMPSGGRMPTGGTL